MKSLNTKLVVSAFGILAMLAGPAFAQKQRHVSHVQGSYVSYVNQSAASQPVPGYDKDGAVVGIPNPDQHW
jgi:hypothetical protein